MTDQPNAETIELLRAQGYEITVPDPSTLRRRQQRDPGQRAIAVISRSGRAYRQDDGRTYGEVDPPEQRQADAGAWRVNAAVREHCEPLTVAVRGTVKRIYEVRDWHPDGPKWNADLGQELTNDDLDRDYPDFPYRVGDKCLTRVGGAYRPEFY